MTEALFRHTGTPFSGFCTTNTIIFLYAKWNWFCYSFLRATMEFRTSKVFTGLTVSVSMLLNLKATKMKWCTNVLIKRNKIYCTYSVTFCLDQRFVSTTTTMTICVTTVSHMQPLAVCIYNKKARSNMIYVLMKFSSMLNRISFSEYLQCTQHTNVLWYVQQMKLLIFFATFIPKCYLNLNAAMAKFCLGTRDLKFWRSNMMGSFLSLCFILLLQMNKSYKN